MVPGSSCFQADGHILDVLPPLAETGPVNEPVNCRGDIWGVVFRSDCTAYARDNLRGPRHLLFAALTVPAVLAIPVELGAARTVTVLLFRRWDLDRHVLDLCLCGLTTQSTVQ